MFKKPLYILLSDLIFVIGAFLFWIWLKPISLNRYLPNYIKPFLIFLGIWLFSSILMRKYRGMFTKRLRKSGQVIVVSNLLALAISTIVIYGFRIDYFARTIVFGTVAIATVIEVIVAFFIYNVVNATEEVEQTLKFLEVEDYTEHKEVDAESKDKVYETHGKQNRILKKKLIETCGKLVYDVLIENIDPFYPKTLVLSTTTQFNVDKQKDEYFESVINIKNVNDIRHLNRFFRAVNYKLPIGGMFIGCAETKDMRKKRILEKYPLIINYLFYILDFIFARVLPKFQFTKPFYYFITKGRDRVFSKAEILGRLYYCGYELVREVITNDKYFFVMHKISSPHKTPRSKYGLFIKLRRVGKNKKKIVVYKLRTMHPYSEYIQDLVYSRHGTEDGDKARNDYRITTMGRVFRRLWLDEFPMVLNLIKGQIKVVGVRPLSHSKFNMYPHYMQEKRTRCKPGLIPPFYVDIPKSFDELVASEEKYLEQYFNHPIRTDFKYFFKALHNILIKKARSG